LDNVDLRFRVDKIYTNTGTILIAMNPFKWLPLYGTEVMKQYMNKAHGTMPPHCFAEAEAAHQAIHSNASSKDQAIVICGESGAGKTETTKLMLAFLSFVSESKDKTKTSVVSPLSPQKVPKGPESTDLSVSERLVESSPLLEALGNAKTQRNNNSSRFGKFTALHYKSAGGATGQVIIGGKLTNLLLESSRVVFQPHNERNYHIFFQVNFLSTVTLSLNLSNLALSDVQSLIILCIFLAFTVHTVALMQRQRSVIAWVGGIATAFSC